MTISRRHFLAAMGSVGLGAMAPRIRLMAAESESDFDYVLVAEAADVEIIPGTTSPCLTFNSVAPAPTLHVKQGDRLRVKVINNLDLPTTIHWHGIRIDINMDGVPWLTQPPIMPGESFVYDFEVPDAGTFWYHPHIYSIEQLSRGLVGMLIVEEKEQPAFDVDLPLALKKWRLKPDGQFLKLSIPRQAARMGTPGTVQTVNDQLDPVYEVPAGAAVRLRFANLDNTVSYDLELDEPSARHIAYDGMPLNPPREMQAYTFGPGMRVDIGLIAPAEEGVEIPIYQLKKNKRQLLLTLKTVASVESPRTELPQLPANPLSVPDLEKAETLQFTFDWSGVIAPDEKGKPSFWAINKIPFQGITKDSVPPPIAKLELGKSYIFELKNTSQYHHPIHMHGMIFTVLDSIKREIVPYQADTVMLQAYDTVRVAFVADNPGRWMYHCHVIEHMKTGLMAYVDVG